MTYTWEATGQTPQVHLGYPDDQAEFIWEETGVKAVWVTAQNCGGSVNATHIITVTNEPPVADAGPGQTVAARR